MTTQQQEFEDEEVLALARHEIQRGEFEDALLKLKRLAAGHEPPPDALAVIARLYAQLGLMKRARESFQKYLELKPDAAHETFELGATHFDQGNNQQALDYWRRALELQPTHPPALFFSALALSRTGKIADARHQLDVLFKSAPADNLYTERGQQLLKQLDGNGFTEDSTAPAITNRYGGH